MACKGREESIPQHNSSIYKCVVAYFMQSYWVSNKYVYIQTGSTLTCESNASVSCSFFDVCPNCNQKKFKHTVFTLELYIIYQSEILLAFEILILLY